MKKLILLLAMAMFCIHVSAQEDPKVPGENKDTIRVGGIIIVKKGKKKDGNVELKIGGDNPKKKKSNVSTNWWILDLGFANYNDRSNYATAGNYLVNRPGYPALDKNDFKLRAGKSINVNIWVFMQRLNLIKHHVNLKYGFGVELNNYRYKSAINYNEGGLVPYTANTQTNAPFIFRDSISFSKNKLAADYATIPVMLNFVSHPNQRKKGVSLSVGVSAGYLYSQRNKQKSNERGKLKNKGDYGLERFKFSYIAELGLGPVLLYGSYSPKSIYEKSLDIRPYNVGFRFSYW
ncbi:MAG: outer membrane beta-barrel protein [Chitinophagaceae bacterium]|nr:outer membrane beta-barrel protein [Chitinophagaceae bacterium]MBK7558086.1 outer membrane beta-barrel protein [Chitinophagaceae bacterium]MBK9531781.1 outer membrane beta-barrel protein [Chitinophagaceae bacterium]